MSILFVIEDPGNFPLTVPGVTPVAARTYIEDDSFSSIKGAKVVNICQSYRYQNLGYYVSLLAEARKHKVIPSITTIQDLKTQSIINVASNEIEENLARYLVKKREDKFQINIYFGKTNDERLNPLASKLYKFFPTPFMAAQFVKTKSEWSLQNINPISIKEIPKEDFDFLQQSFTEVLAGKKIVAPSFPTTSFDLAILYDPKEDATPPSNPLAIKKFIKAAENLGMGTEIVTLDDSRRMSEFDALFIRETTNVSHHTYRMARKAFAEGLVVIDDPVSILRCSNKVFLAELLERYKVPIPKTMIVHSKNMNKVVDNFDLPVILKQPDSSFSQGVLMAKTKEELLEGIKTLFQKSHLIIAQEFIPTEFDWRIGVLDKKPIFACKYYMASSHWQIVRREKDGSMLEGKGECVPIEDVPKTVLTTALRAANLIGDGLYGVDLKQVGMKVVVIEVNDNPNIDSGLEDCIYKDELYATIMRVFLQRIEKRKVFPPAAG